MTVELYFFQPLGTNSARMYLALLEKEVQFIERELSGRLFEHLQPAYLKINPKGQVPALVHDDMVMTEGGPTNEYIDEAFDGPPLRPADLRERCAMHWWCRVIDIEFGRSLMMVNWNRVVPMFAGAKSREEFEAILESVPLPDRRRAWRRAFLADTPIEQIDESRRRMAAVAARVEQTLAKQPWLAGQSYSLADIDLYSYFYFVPEWMPELVNPKATPALIDWLAKAIERPAVAEMMRRRRDDKGLETAVTAAAALKTGGQA